MASKCLLGIRGGKGDVILVVKVVGQWSIVSRNRIKFRFLDDVFELETLLIKS